MICKENKLNEQKWSKILGITILDPDGWRNDNTPLEKKIIFDDYLNRMSYSTIMINSYILIYDMITTHNMIIYLLKYGKRLNVVYDVNKININGRLDNHTFKATIITSSKYDGRQYSDSSMIIYLNRKPIMIKNIQELDKFIKGLEREASK